MLKPESRPHLEERLFFSCCLEEFLIWPHQSRAIDPRFERGYPLPEGVAVGAGRMQFGIYLPEQKMQLMNVHPLPMQPLRVVGIFGKLAGFGSESAQTVAQVIP